MDKKDIYHGNILLGTIILGYALFNFFMYDKQPNLLTIVAAFFLITVGLIGLKFLKIK
jgi:hypothetical protein